MSEFNNRIAAQREILMIVNSFSWKEELFGLSSGAIARWVSANQLSPSGLLVSLIRLAAEKLFFLSNKSQEQVSDEYRLLSLEVHRITSEIKGALRNF